MERDNFKVVTYNWSKTITPVCISKKLYLKLHKLS